MKRPLVRALEHRPKRFDTIGMRHAVDVRADRVLDRLMEIRDPLIGRSIVGVNHRIVSGVVGHKPLQRRLVRGRDNRGTDLVGRAILGSDHGGHVHRSASLGVLARFDLFLRLPPL